MIYQASRADHDLALRLSAFYVWSEYIPPETRLNASLQANLFFSSSNKKRFANVLRHVSKFFGDSEYQAISFRLQLDCNGGRTNIIGNLISFLAGWTSYK